MSTKTVFVESVSTNMAIHLYFLIIEIRDINVYLL